MAHMRCIVKSQVNLSRALNHIIKRNFSLLYLEVCPVPLPSLKAAGMEYLTVFLRASSVLTRSVGYCAAYSYLDHSAGGSIRSVRAILMSILQHLEMNGLQVFSLITLLYEKYSTTFAVIADKIFGPETIRGLSSVSAGNLLYMSRSSEARATLESMGWPKELLDACIGSKYWSISRIIDPSLMGQFGSKSTLFLARVLVHTLEDKKANTTEEMESLFNLKM